MRKGYWDGSADICVCIGVSVVTKHHYFSLGSKTIVEDKKI